MNSALWERGCDGGEQGAISVGECWSVDPAAQACELVAQHNDLEVSRPRETQGTPGPAQSPVRLTYCEYGASCLTPATTRASTTCCHLAKRPTSTAAGRTSISQSDSMEMRRAN